LNLPAAPLVGLIMAFGYIYLFFNSLLPTVGHLLSIVLKMLVRFFSWMTTWLEPFNSLSYRIPSPPLIVVLSFYLFLFLFLLKTKFRGQKLITAAGFLVSFLILITFPFRPESRGLVVTFMDVGQGDSIVIEFPQGRLMVIDAGGFPQSPFDPGESLVSPYLWHKGYKKIDYLVSTHLHPDHAGGLPSLARNFKIKEYWYAEENPESLLEKEINKALPARVKKIKIRTGLETTCAGARIEVLYPDEQAFSHFKPGNDVSAVLKLEFAQYSFLFAADITSPVEDYLVGSSAQKLKATVLKIPHHGSRSSSSQAFLEAVLPEWAVITSGRNNVYGFPEAQVLSRLKASGIKTLRTDLDGAIQFQVSGPKLMVRTAVSGNIN
ncbi:MAG: ComEC/Rec2 family competence protein, partial [Candidatus Saccharicenans sp.]